MAQKIEEFVRGIRENGIVTDKDVTLSGATTLSQNLSRTGEMTETVDDNKTLDEGDSGVVQIVTIDAKTVTLPATAVGTTYIIRNGGADGAVAVTISPNANDKIMGAGLTSADNKDLINTKATAKQGDEVVLVADGASGWFVQRIVGTWAREA